ncbi:hypothetical protein EYF80_054611 [Liparis tanakae]|uniref:Uncharacterized protein n=1 Tax=Liparis tanakae TaxID=230148 RepID=A0A4Z2F1X9_9TELE|nr:hypothetical protein EYF80_054611 [Liparis tanakae]
MLCRNGSDQVAGPPLSLWCNKGEVTGTRKSNKDGPTRHKRERGGDGVRPAAFMSNAALERDYKGGNAG